ncbi:hypothetical protein [Streptomyces sp. NRRL WC-3742]|uniref:hypothetical protein n=1 Tax=Streptomyces sp. NRRL WC-3742 TaxID=1463934 RepID=UPI0004C576D0|nr:hypothetical protein [Streptomyces sp. NRRL WC-3742]
MTIALVVLLTVVIGVEVYAVRSGKRRHSWSQALVGNRFALGTGAAWWAWCAVAAIMDGEPAGVIPGFFGAVIVASLAAAVSRAVNRRRKPHGTP